MSHCVVKEQASPVGDQHLNQIRYLIGYSTDEATQVEFVGHGASWRINFTPYLFTRDEVNRIVAEFKATRGFTYRDWVCNRDVRLDGLLRIAVLRHEQSVWFRLDGTIGESEEVAE